MDGVNAELTERLARLKALEAHLPPGYDIGDDATAELAVRLAEVTAERDRERETNAKAIEILDKIAKESLRDGIALQGKLREAQAMVERLKGERDALRDFNAHDGEDCHACLVVETEPCPYHQGFQDGYRSCGREDYEEVGRLKAELERLREAVRLVLKELNPSSALQELAAAALGADEGRA